MLVNENNCRLWLGKNPCFDADVGSESGKQEKHSDYKTEYDSVIDNHVRSKYGRLSGLRIHASHMEDESTHSRIGLMQPARLVKVPKAVLSSL